MRPDTWNNTQRAWLQTGFPFTIALMVLKFLSLFLFTAESGFTLASQLMFIAPDSLLRPWTLFTYPLLSGLPFLSFLFDIGITYWFCSSLERAWGTAKFALFFGAVALTSALALSLGALLFQTQFGAEDLLPIAAAAVAWGMLNAEERVSLYFIPMRGIHMALIAVLYIMFQYAQGGNWRAVPFALAGCGLSYLWVRNGWQYGMGTLLPHAAVRAAKRPNLRIVPPKSPKPKDDRFTLRDLSPLEWIARRKRRKQFEKLINDD
ncbi:MAG TPA: DUF1751 domain-containing protein [Abditibacterium sp.]|jgi:hypothetical protein